MSQTFNSLRMLSATASPSTEKLKVLPASVLFVLAHHRAKSREKSCRAFQATPHAHASPAPSQSPPPTMSATRQKPRRSNTAAQPQNAIWLDKPKNKLTPRHPPKTLNPNPNPKPTKSGLNAQATGKFSTAQDGARSQAEPQTVRLGAVAGAHIGISERKGSLIDPCRPLAFRQINCFAAPARKVASRTSG